MHRQNNKNISDHNLEYFHVGVYVPLCHNAVVGIS